MLIPYTENPAIFHTMATISASRTAPNDTTMDIGTTHPFTCNTCQVAFRNIDLQKGHMRSDWQ